MNITVFWFLKSCEVCVCTQISFSFILFINAKLEPHLRSKVRLGLLYPLTKWCIVTSLDERIGFYLQINRGNCNLLLIFIDWPLYFQYLIGLATNYLGQIQNKVSDGACFVADKMLDNFSDRRQAMDAQNKRDGLIEGVVQADCWIHGHEHRWGRRLQQWNLDRRLVSQLI